MHQYGAIFDYGILHLEWPTALFILVVFVATMLFLNTLLFKPVTRSLEGRAQMLKEGDSRLAAIEAQLKAAQADFDAAQAKMIAQIGEQYQATITDAQKQAHQITDAAKEQSATKLAQATSEIDQEMNQATEEAKTLAKELAAMIQTKVLNG